MANRSSSTGLNTPKQNEVNHYFFYGGKSGVKFKNLGASRFVAVSAHFFLLYSQTNQDVEVMRG